LKRSGRRWKACALAERTAGLKTRRYYTA
jgi:hypothetical protein